MYSNTEFETKMETYIVGLLVLNSKELWRVRFVSENDLDWRFICTCGDIAIRSAKLDIFTMLDDGWFESLETIAGGVLNAFFNGEEAERGTEEEEAVRPKRAAKGKEKATEEE